VSRGGFKGEGDLVGGLGMLLASLGWPRPSVPWLSITYPPSPVAPVLQLPPTIEQLVQESCHPSLDASLFGEFVQVSLQSHILEAFGLAVLIGLAQLPN